MAESLAAFNSIPGLGPLETIKLSYPSPFVLHLEFARPNSLNAMSPRFFREITEVFKMIPEDGDVRCVVVTAQGRMVGLERNTTGGSELIRPTSFQLYPLPSTLHLIPSSSAPVWTSKPPAKAAVRPRNPRPPTRLEKLTTSFEASERRSKVLSEPWKNAGSRSSLLDTDM